jgi:hypothetical protein
VFGDAALRRGAAGSKTCDLDFGAWDVHILDLEFRAWAEGLEIRAGGVDECASRKLKRSFGELKTTG